MGLFSCKSCESKDAEIAFLRRQVEGLQDKAMNMADNHLQARLEASKHVPAPPTHRDDQPRRRMSANRYEAARARADRPIPRTQEELDLASRALEDEFKRTDPPNVVGGIEES